MHVLFICNQNQHRSRTAQELFKEQFETSSAGLYNRHPLTHEQLGRADLVIVMEEAQRCEIAKRFPTLYLQKKILSLDIPDIYRYQQKELIDILKERVTATIHEIA